MRDHSQETENDRNMVTRVPVRVKSASIPEPHLSPPEKLYFCCAGCCATGPSAFRSKEKLRLHEIARMGTRTKSVEVGTTSKAEYERAWNELMAKQKEEEKKLERMYVEKWFRNIK